MSTNFPTSVDNGTSLPNPTGTSTQASPDHAGLHTSENAAIIAIENKLGTGASTPTNNTFLTGNGTGTSVWSKVVPAGTVVGTTDSQTLTNKTLTSPTINTATISNPTLTVDTISGFTVATNLTAGGVTLQNGAVGGTTGTFSSTLTANNGFSLTSGSLTLPSGSVTSTFLASTAVNSGNVDWTTSTGKVWWQELGRNTAGGTVSSLSITSFTARKYLRIIIYGVGTGGSIGTGVRFNNDTATNYAYRSSSNGGADTTTTSATFIYTSGNSNNVNFVVVDVINVTAQEKLLTGQTIENNTTGAGTAPDRRLVTGKWANTAAQITRVDVVNVNGGTGNFAAGSEVIVLGHD